MNHFKEIGNLQDLRMTKKQAQFIVSVFTCHMVELYKKTYNRSSQIVSRARLAGQQYIRQIPFASSYRSCLSCVNMDER